MPITRRQQRVLNEKVSRILACTQQIESRIAALNPEFLLEKILCRYQLFLLNEIEQALAQSDPLSALNIVLQRHWQRIKQGAAFPYTALPRDPVTLLLCDIATMISLETDKPAINILMPDVCTENLCGDNYPDLTTLDLQTVLINHVLSDSKRYLIPRTLLSEHPLLTKGIPQLPNVYYDDSFNEPDYYINAQEYQRLISHSNDSLTLKEALDNYQLLYADNKGLLGQLETLIMGLLINSTAGRGSEKLAGEQAYLVILDFFKYYDQLDKQALKQIPESIKSEINKLKSYASSSTDNQLAGVDTCINTRQMKLKQAVEEHREILSAIDLSDIQKMQLLTQVKENFAASKKALQSLLMPVDTENAHENLQLNHAILEHLQFKITIESPADLQNFLTLSAHEIEQLISKNKNLQKQIVKQFATIESLVLFSIETPIDKLKIIITYLKDDLIEKLIKKSEHLRAWFIALEDYRMKAIVDILDDKLSQIIKTADDFNIILEHLNTEQRNIIYHKQKARLYDMIKDGNTFHLIVEFLTDQQVKRISHKLYRQGNVRKLINNANVLNIFFQHYTISMRNKIYDEIKSKIPNMINNSIQFKNILKYLSDEQKEEVYTSVKNKIHKLVNNANDFCHIVKYLNKYERIEVERMLEFMLPNLITASKYCLLILELSNQNQRINIFNKIKHRLPALIKEKDDIRNVLYSLEENQCKEACEYIKDNIYKIINSADDLISLCSYLKDFQCTMICQLVIDKLPQLIKTPEMFFALISSMSNPEDVILALTNQLPDLILSAFDFHRCHSWIPENDRVKVYSAFKTLIPKLIKNAEDFSYVIRYLLPNQRNELYNSFKEKLADFIQTSTDVIWIFEFLEPQQRDFLFENNKMKIIKQIKNSNDFKNVCMFLRLDQVEIIINSQRFNLNDLMKNYNDFINITQCMTPTQCKSFCQSLSPEQILYLKGHISDIADSLSKEQRAAVYETLVDKDKLHTMIDSFEEYYEVLKELSATSKCKLYHKTQDYLPLWIDEFDDLVDLIKVLNLNECQHLCDNIINKLSYLINDCLDFTKILNFSSDKIQVVFHALSFRLFDVINHSKDIKAMFKELNCDQRNAMFDILQIHLPTLIHNTDDFGNVMKYLNSEQRSAVYQAVKQKLPGMLNGNNAYPTILRGKWLNYLNLVQKAGIYSSILQSTSCNMLSSMSSALFGSTESIMNTRLAVINSPHLRARKRKENESVENSVCKRSRLV